MQHMEMSIRCPHTEIWPNYPSGLDGPHPGLAKLEKENPDRFWE